MTGSLLIPLISLLMMSVVEGQSRVWSIGIGHEWGSHEYIDTDGYLKGVGIDLIDHVCGEANMDCRIIRDKYQGCWQSNPGDHPSGGRGLLGRWYDACTSWYPTVERSHTFKFTQSHFKSFLSYFYSLQGREFDPSNMRGKVLGFVKGWAYNEKCLARDSDVQGYTYSPSNSKFYDSPTEAVRALQSGEVDAVFGNDIDWTVEQFKVISKLSRKSFNCLLGGNAMMSRKDSPFTAYWNIGLSKLIDTNKINKFCEKTNPKHAHKGDPWECV